MVNFSAGAVVNFSIDICIGPINYFLRLIGIPGVKWITTNSTALLSMILVDVWEWTPFMFLLLLSALQTIPVELYEAARVDGAYGFQLLRTVKLPLIKGVMLVAIVLRSMDAFRVFDTIFVMTGGGPGDATDVVNIRVYRAAFLNFEMGYAAAMVVLLIVILSILSTLYFRLSADADID